MKYLLAICIAISTFLTTAEANTKPTRKEAYNLLYRYGNITHLRNFFNYALDESMGVTRVSYEQYHKPLPPNHWKNFKVTYKKGLDAVFNKHVNVAIRIIQAHFTKQELAELAKLLKNPVMAKLVKVATKEAFNPIPLGLSTDGHKFVVEATMKASKKLEK